MKFFQKYISVLFLTMFLAIPTFAGNLEDITNVMKEKVNAIITTLKDPTMLKCEKNVKISQISEGIFDYTLMSKLSIGKKTGIDFLLYKKKSLLPFLH